MTPAVDSSPKGIKTLDKDLRRIALMERALIYTSRPLVSLGVALIFMVLAGLAAMALMGGQPVRWSWSRVL
jgi:inorganic phosphate transporter, PiT family